MPRHTLEEITGMDILLIDDEQNLRKPLWLALETMNHGVFERKPTVHLLPAQRPVALC